MFKQYYEFFHCGTGGWIGEKGKIVKPEEKEYANCLLPEYELKGYVERPSKQTNVPREQIGENWSAGSSGAGAGGRRSDNGESAGSSGAASSGAASKPSKGSK